MFDFFCSSYSFVFCFDVSKSFEINFVYNVCTYSCCFDRSSVWSIELIIVFYRGGTVIELLVSVFTPFSEIEAVKPGAGSKFILSVDWSSFRFTSKAWICSVSFRCFWLAMRFTTVSSFSLSFFRRYSFIISSSCLIYVSIYSCYFFFITRDVS